MTKTRLKGIAGWEKWGSTSYLRVDLAEAELTAVWPCSGSASEPQSENRKLTQIVMPLSDVQRAVQDSGFAKREGYGAGDVALMKEALEDQPRRGAAGQAETNKPKASPPVGLSMGL